MKLNEFYYDLPKELIAQVPLDKRDISRLMVINRVGGNIKHMHFRDIRDYLRPGDCLVLNDTRVIAARIFGQRKTGAKVELFIIDRNPERPIALVRPSGRIKIGETIMLDDGKKARIMGNAGTGRFVEFNAPIDEILKNGHVPLPPYIRRDDNEMDASRYQTVYARRDGATASPTAGLHFTGSLIKGLSDNGVKIVYITLHIGYGTFAPVKAENIEDHKMHTEYFELGEEQADVINSVKASGGRIIAVGTTSSRVLETSAFTDGKVRSIKGETNLFIYPGYRFKMIDGIITNFHLPGSTLLMLVSAFAGKDLILDVYKEAVKMKYRFFSYGDAMLIV